MRPAFTTMLLLLPLAAGALAPGLRAAELPERLTIPFVEDWRGSAHAKLDAEAYNHWNEEPDQRIPEACARCHSTAGFLDYLGADGSTAGKVDAKPAIGSVLTCEGCHNAATLRMTAVTFPSGKTVKDVGTSARCMQCHQGRESSLSLTAKLQGMAPDGVDPKLPFVNLHYRAAGVTLMGDRAAGAYQEPTRAYDGPRDHPQGARLCVECHDPHSLKVRVELCNRCHEGTEKRQDFVKIRKSKTDYDGDGDIKEGIAGEIETMHGALLAGIQHYAAKSAGVPIAYDASQFPYFFKDGDGDGKVGPAEAEFPNRYASWTPRLLKAAYNFLYVAKEPGAFAHNAPYVMQVLYDSLASLAETGASDVSAMVRP